MTRVGEGVAQERDNTLDNPTLHARIIIGIYGLHTYFMNFKSAQLLSRIDNDGRGSRGSPRCFSSHLQVVCLTSRRLTDIQRNEEG